MNPRQNDIGHYIKTNNNSIPIQNVNAGSDVNGTGFDRQGYGSGVMQAQTGSATGSPSAQTHRFVLEESSDNSTFTTAQDRSGNDITIDITEDDKLDEIDVDFQALKRYLRVTYDASESSFTGGSSPTNDIAASLIFGGADELPA